MDEHFQNIRRSIVQAFLEALGGDIRARRFLRDQGIRLAINEQEAALVIEAAQQWVAEQNEAFEGFERENGA